jgi:hypothetical protein
VAPWATVGGLIVISLVAAVVSIVITPSKMSASEQLNAAVRSTIAVSSFTMTLAFNRQTPRTIVYQAPDKTEQLSRNGSVELYDGRTLIYDYEASPQRKWVEQPIAQGVAYAQAMANLAPILQAREVEQGGDVFRFIRTVRGEEIHGTARVENGFIVAETFKLTSTQGGIRERVHYSRFGSSPPVTIPDSSGIAKAVRCGGYYIPPDSSCRAP